MLPALALEQGINLKVVQERLGHSTVNITLNVYSHVSPTMHAEAADLVAALILSLNPSPGAGDGNSRRRAFRCGI